MNSKSQSRCPSCGDLLQFSTEDTGGVRFAPFCSKRCKDIDLGRWLVEDYTIPAAPDLEDEF